MIRRGAGILALSLLLGAAACSARPDPERPRFRTGSVTLHGDGSFQKGHLVEPTDVDGLPAQRWVHRHADGTLRGLQLAADAAVGGRRFPAGTFLWFGEGGVLEHVWLSRDQDVDGYRCTGGMGKVSTAFHPDGSLRSFFPPHDVRVGHVLCKSSMFAPVRLHPDGSLDRAQVAEDVEIAGAAYRAGDMVELAPGVVAGGR